MTLVSEDVIQATTVLESHTEKVWHVAFSPDGSRIVTTSDAGTASLWDQDGKHLAVLDGGERTVRSAAFSPDGSRIVILADAEDHAIRVWSSEGKELAVLSGHTDTVRSAVFSPDGNRVLTASVDKTARLWDADGETVAVIGHKDSIEQAMFISSGACIVTTSNDGTTRISDIKGTQLIASYRHAGGFPTYSHDGSRILSTNPGAPDGTAYLLNNEGQELAVLAGHTSMIRSAAFSPDGSRALTGSLDGTARLWDREGKLLAVLAGHTAGVRHAVFSSDGSRIVTVSDDKTARLWDGAGKPVAVLVGHTGRLTHAAFSPDGTRIVTTAEDGARLYRVAVTNPDSSHGAAPIERAARLRFETEVRSMAEDKEGNLWFGSHMEGVARFDGEDYTYFTVDDGLSSNQAWTMVADQNGAVWIGTRDGISCYAGERFINYSRTDAIPRDDWRLEAGDVWLPGHRGAYRYDGKELAYLALPLEDHPADDWSYGMTGLTKGKDGNLWFGMWGAVAGYDGESFTILLDDDLDLDNMTGTLHGRCIFADSRGRVWIGNNGIGVLLLDGEKIVNFTQTMGVGRRDSRSGGQTTTRMPGDAAKGAPSLHRVFAIAEDRDGNIWFGSSEQGAWRYDGKSLRQFTAKDGLTTKGLMCIYKDSRGDLLVGGHGVFRWNGESFDRVH